MQLTVIGLGVANGDVSVNALEQIKKASFVLLRTEKTRSVGFLKEMAIGYTALDYLYERSRSFNSLTKNLVAEVKKYLKTGDVCYLVDGSVFEDRCAKELIAKIKGVKIFNGVSKVESALSECGITDNGYTAVSAYDKDDFTRFSFPLAVYDLDSRILASEWKLKLADIVGEEAKVTLYIDKRPKTIFLYELDREENFDYSTVLILPKTPLTKKLRFDFYDLMEILRILRSPDGCPWDKVQTPESIRINLVEEAYELVDAIDKRDDDKMQEETGDVILQAGFHILFAEERGAYGLYDVFSGICAKLIARHTHVFGRDKATDAETALNVWNKNKQVEKGYSNVADYASDVPECLPALLRCSKVVKRAINGNFDVMTDEELYGEIERLLKDKDNYNKNSGYLLFCITYLLKKGGADAEQSLADEIKAFINKLEKVENELSSRGIELKNADKALVKKLYDEY